MRVLNSSSSAAVAAAHAAPSVRPSLPPDYKVKTSAEAPYFADGVYARAKANRDKLANFNRARVNEPLALAAIIRQHYENHPLVVVLKQSLSELSEERGRECFLRFEEPTYLILTREGFCQGHGYNNSWEPLGDSVRVGDRGTAAAARTRIDASLAMFAEDTEKNVVEGQLIERKKAAPAKKRRGFFGRLFHRRRHEHSFSVKQCRYAPR